MGIAIFFVMAAAVSVILIYPLLPGRAPAQESPALTDGEIDQLVRNLRLARGGDGLYCPTCGTAYQAADRYCGRCGNSLPQAQTVSTGSACPSCGAGLREGDLFCAKCGHQVAVREVE
jgi:predicted amidophosphoribosyltransferase